MQMTRAVKQFFETVTIAIGKYLLGRRAELADKAVGVCDPPMSAVMSL